MSALRAPFPWFGGKSRAAHLVWQRFGDVPNFVEPFAGSLAVLLARPTPPRVETVNDIDCYLANFWRAVKADAASVAEFADWPVNEADLHARHRWLVNQTEFRERLKTDPDYFDAKVAGWWVWGICQWIGSGWCSAPEWEGRANAGRRSRGVNTAEQAVRPDISGERGIHGKRPVLAHSNRGVHLVSHQKPMLRGDGGATGAGIHASGLSVPTVHLPYLKSDGQGIAAAGKAPIEENESRVVATGEAILGWMLALQERMRRVRVCCGDWKRVLGRSVTECIGVTGIFLDPPYGDVGRDTNIYNHDDLSVASAVREWAIENGDNPKLRIALCGYAGEHDMPATWECVPWKAAGGYAGSVGNHENSKRERIWFSPHCRRRPTLFTDDLMTGAGELTL